MLSKSKKAIRKLVRTKENEKITDAIDRHKTKILKKFSTKEFGRKEVEEYLISIGVSKGDTLIVHCSWRKFYNFNGNVKDFISIIVKIIGENGTLMMPCYGADKRFFSVNTTPSNAGVVSEVFRKEWEVKRSECGHFSVCGIGNRIDYFLNEHGKSVFGFDTYSPYYKISQDPTVKILMIGMGKKPVKLTLIHCVEYMYRNKYKYFNQYLSNYYTSVIEDSNGNKTTRNMIEGGYARLYKRNIKEVYSHLSFEDYKWLKLRNLDIVLVNANKTFNVIDHMVNNKKVMLKPPLVEKDSFELVE